MIKKTIDCDIKMNNIDDNPDKIRLTKGIYEILYNKNNYNIISKIIDNENKIDIKKSIKKNINVI